MPIFRQRSATGYALVGLLQYGGDVLDGKALLLHGTASWPLGLIVPQNSPWESSERAGAPQPPPPLDLRVRKTRALPSSRALPTDASKRDHERGPARGKTCGTFR